MRSRKSSGYYRKSSYKKRKLRNILIISAICLFLLFLLFVIFGNRLNKKVQNERTAKEKAQTTAEAEADTSTYAIEGYFVELSPETDITARMKELSSVGARSVSLKLTDAQGKLLVGSELARSLGYQKAEDDVVDLSSVVSKARYYGMFSSAVLDLGFLSEKDSKQRAVILAYEAALVVEVSEKGIGDVIVRAPTVDGAQLDLLMDFADSVKSINGDVVLGVALPIEFFYRETAAEDVSRLTGHFDIIGLDISEIPSDTKDVFEYIDGAFSESNIKYYVLRYNMRVLLPQTSDEQDEMLREVLSENSIQNWQKIS